MARISEYVRSLPGVARRSIEAVLSDSSSINSNVTIRNSASIDASELRPLTPVTSAKINSVLSRVSAKNSDIWNTVSEIDRYIRTLNERCDATASRASRGVSKASAILNAVFLSASRHETIDKLYAETYSSMDGTDLNATTAVLSSGMLVLPEKKSNVVSGTWSIKTKDPSSANVTIDPVTGCILASYETITSQSMLDTLVVTAAFSLTTPTTATSIALNVSDSDISAVRIINSSGQTTTIALDRRVRMNETISVGFDRTNISMIEVVLSQSHYTSEPTNGSRHRILPIDKTTRMFIDRAAIGSKINRYGMGSVYSLAKRIRKMDPVLVNSEWVGRNVNSSRKIKNDRVAKPINPTSKYRMVLSVPSMNVYDTIREEQAEWTSLPITIYGDVRKTSMVIEQDQDPDVNTKWLISVEGRPWTPIIPENAREITGELLSFDFSGTASLFYPADANSNIQLHGVPFDANIKTVTAKDGSILAIKTDKVTTSKVTVDYTTTFSGIVRLDDIGLTGSDVKVSDAMTNGNLGEHGTATNQFTIQHEPHGEIDVYVNGVKALLLPSTDSLIDPSLDSTLVYYQLFGKTIFLKSNTEVDVSVYYKYAQTSIRIKANLESSKASDGKTPQVNSMTIAVKTMSA